MDFKKQFDSLPWGDLTKPIVAVVFSTGSASGAAYYSTLLPSINPKIIQDIWFFNVLAMIVASVLAYFLSLNSYGRPHRWPGYLAGTVFAACLVGHQALSLKVLLVVDAAAAALLDRLFLIGLFASLSGVIAWGFASAAGRQPPAARLPELLAEPGSSEGDGSG
jgi:hypothetical protein